jgi:hypothetical protein
MRNFVLLVKHTLKEDKPLVKNHLPTFQVVVLKYVKAKCQVNPKRKNNGFN